MINVNSGTIEEVPQENREPMYKATTSLEDKSMTFYTVSAATWWLYCIDARVNGGRNR